MADKKEHRKKVTISPFLMTYQTDGSPKGLVLDRQPTFKEATHILEKILSIRIRKQFGTDGSSREDMDEQKKEIIEQLSIFLVGDITITDLVDGLGTEMPTEGFPPTVYYELLHYITKTGIVRTDEIVNNA